METRLVAERKVIRSEDIQPQPGPWIPEIFRSMAACDENGDMWVIDQTTWQWVPKQVSAGAKP